MTAKTPSRRLIERWLPIAALGEESVRERRSMTALPPTYYLHVWWARRPLVASRAAVLASLLPEDTDPNKFLHAIGIHGDPVASRRRIDAAKRAGERFEGEAYSYSRAFSYNVNPDEVAWIRSEVARAGIDEQPVVLDPTAGGGSIPFEAVRLGFSSAANDLNPVAAFILRATVQIPAKFGLAIAREFERIADLFVRLREECLKPFFPSEPEKNAIATNFLWARTITCPHCDGIVPLSPNWKLSSDGTGVRLTANPKTRRCTFAIVTKAADHSEGTVSDGDAICPFPDCGRVIDGTIIKAQAQQGQMGEQLYAVVFKRRVIKKTKTGKERESWERGYRVPRAVDEVLDKVRAKLAEKLPEWEANDIVPTEKIDELSNYDRGHRLYGMTHWRDVFSARQFLGHAFAVECFRELLDVERNGGKWSEVTRCAFGYLALSLDKLRDYNSRMTRWHTGREVMVNTFDQHNFSMKWSFAEMSSLVQGIGVDWAVAQTAKCIEELVQLARPDIDVKAERKGRGQGTLTIRPGFTPPPVTITCKSGDSLDHIAEGGVDAVVMDPPYYNNVMYAELSDFFYVWLKRTAGYVFPELFKRQLTDKESEAVANPAKFQGQKGAVALANEDYRARMQSIFAECRRVLKPDGILTLMFTHKATGAWDALAQGLMMAGFTITASWPINTESEGSLHVKDKSAANSTIFLVCRPRLPSAESDEPLFWEDVEPRVRQAVRARIEEFQKAGISGVDLYLSCFGPALEEFSRHWPLKRGQPRPAEALRRRRRGAEEDAPPPDPYAVLPEDALEAARREVKRWRLEKLTRMGRKEGLDPLTEWFVLAWDAFRAPEFPYDEALRLARVVGLDLDGEIIGRVAEKKASSVILWDGATRAAKGKLSAEDGSRSMLDVLHLAAHVGRTRTLAAAREMVERNRLNKEERFLGALEALLEVLPVSKSMGGPDLSGGALAASSDFEVLENLRQLAFSKQVDKPTQLSLLEVSVA